MDQLPMLEVVEATWRLDRHTVETGRRGVAEAREALRVARDRALSRERAGSLPGAGQRAA